MTIGANIGHLSSRTRLLNSNKADSFLISRSIVLVLQVVMKGRVLSSRLLGTSQSQ